MEEGKQIQICTEEEEHAAPAPGKPAPANRFMCRDCQERGERPLTVAVQYRAKVEHLLGFCEETGDYRLTRTTGDLDDDVELFCCACGFDVPTTSDEQERIAKAAGVININGRVSITCEHATGAVEIIF